MSLHICVVMTNRVVSCLPEIPHRGSTFRRKLGPQVFRLKRLVGLGVAVLAVTCCSGLGGSSASATHRLGPDAPLCTSWSPLGENSANLANVEITVFKHATRGPSAVYLRDCGAASQYRYVDTGTGRVSCLTDALPYRLRTIRTPSISFIPPYRCD